MHDIKTIETLQTILKMKDETISKMQNNGKGWEQRL